MGENRGSKEKIYYCTSSLPFNIVLPGETGDIKKIKKDDFAIILILYILFKVFHLLRRVIWFARA